jgi:hypothetical protein
MARNLSSLLAAAIAVSCSQAEPPPGADGGAQDGGAASVDGGNSTPDSGTPDGGGSPDAGNFTDGGAAGDAGGTTPGDAGVTVLPLGTLTVTDSGVQCLGGAGVGASCMNVKVSCPGLPDLFGMIAVAEPTGSARGTIVTHTGGSGVGFFAAGAAGKGTEQALTKAGYRFVQLSWDTDWASTGDIKKAACRPATVFQWVFDNVHGGSRSTGFCGIGSSGGTAALSYSLAAYGMKGSFDYAMLLAGPTPARIDYGCDPSSYTGGPRSLCPLLTNAPWMYTPGVQSIADGWTGTHTCGGAAGAGDIAAWQADQLLSAGDDFDYPQTGLSFWYCVSTPNESTGQATFFIDQVHPRNVPDVNCYAGPVDAGGCENEYVLQDSAAFAAAMSEMEASCVPHHP